jgi:hypothetical protein
MGMFLSVFSLAAVIICCYFLTTVDGLLRPLLLHGLIVLRAEALIDLPFSSRSK